MKRNNLGRYFCLGKILSEEKRWEIAEDILQRGGDFATESLGRAKIAEVARTNKVLWDAVNKTWQTFCNTELVAQQQKPLHWDSLRNWTQLIVSLYRH